jgi:hypothetical protein
MHNNLLRSSIDHDKRTGRYDEVAPLHTRGTLSEKIGHMLNHDEQKTIIQPIQVGLQGSGSSQVAYKKQSTVIGGGNVDYK